MPSLGSLSPTDPLFVSTSHPWGCGCRTAQQCGMQDSPGVWDAGQARGVGAGQPRGVGCRAAQEYGCRALKQFVMQHSPGVWVQARQGGVGCRTAQERRP